MSYREGQFHIKQTPTTPCNPIPTHPLDPHHPLAEICVQFWSLFHEQDHLQRYSQSRRLHGSRPFHWFAWYNSCGKEKCPLAVHWQERPPEVVLYSSRPYGGFVNSAVSLIEFHSRDNHTNTSVCLIHWLFVLKGKMYPGSVFTNYYKTKFQNIVKVTDNKQYSLMFWSKKWTIRITWASRFSITQ